jgi:hypothetical protein
MALLKKQQRLWLPVTVPSFTFGFISVNGQFYRELHRYASESALVIYLLSFLCILFLLV